MYFGFLVYQVYILPPLESWFRFSIQKNDQLFEYSIFPKYSNIKPGHTIPKGILLKN